MRGNAHLRVCRRIAIEVNGIRMKASPLNSSYCRFKKVSRDLGEYPGGSATNELGRDEQ